MEELQKLILIVDGPTEEGALKARFYKLFNTSPKFRQGPGNGVDFKVVGYVKGVLPTLKILLSSDVRMIILLPDMEKRKTTPDKFSSSIKKEIIKSLLSSTKYKEDYLEETIYVCPSNIMFENWIVSDMEGIVESELIKDDSVQSEFEGKNGSSVLQKNMLVKYKKTVHGKVLFKIVRDDISIQNSDSYKKFKDKVDEFIAKYCNN